jgi:hypothetical protein
MEFEISMVILFNLQPLVVNYRIYTAPIRQWYGEI